jgi:multidrug efflux pump subunit AcrB
MLAWAVRRKGVVVVIGLLSLGATYGLFQRLPREFLPDEDKGYVLMLLFAPEGATSEYTDRYVRQAENIAKEYPETAGMFSAVALARGAPGESDFGLMFVQLKDGDRRSALDLARPGGRGSMFMRLINEVQGAQAIAILPKATDFTEAFQLVLQGADLGQLEESGRRVAAELAKAGVLPQGRVNLNFQQPQLAFRVDRDRAAGVGVDVRSASEALQLMWGGVDVARYNVRGKEYKVIAQLERESRLVPASLDDIYLRSSAGQIIPASSVLIPEEKGSPNAINRFGRQRSVTVAGQPQGMSLGEAVRQAEVLLPGILPAGVTWRWTGEAEEIQSGSSESVQVLILAVLVVFMILAAQFESLRHPFVIMLALPLALLGAFGSLALLGMVNGLAVIKAYAPLESLPGVIRWLTTHLPEVPAMTLNVYSLIGIVLLLGLVTKNSILLVEFANQRVAEGADATTAMLDAGRTRLRPILMTAFSTVIGILPVALGLGEASGSRRPLGVSVVGGMMTSTFLTLFIVPVVYILISPRKKTAAVPVPVAGAVPAVDGGR